MKKLMIIIIFILSVQIASAMYGGESRVIYSFPECLNLTIEVNASLPIHDGEFSFLNCTKINQSYWISNCSNNFNLTLTTRPNTVNNYSFYILYYNQSGEFTVILNGGGGGGGIICTPKWECTVWTACSPEGIQTRTCTDNKNCRTTSGKPAEIKLCNYVPPRTTGGEEEAPTEEVELILTEGEGMPKTTGAAVTNISGGLGGITGRFFQNLTGIINKWMGLGVTILVLVFGFGFYWFIHRKRRVK